MLPTPKALLATLAAGLLVTSAIAVIAPAPATAAQTVLVNDTFTRTIASGWGTAPGGAAYTVSPSSAASLSVASNTGVIGGLKPGGSATVTLASESVADVDLTANIQVPAAPVSLFHAFELRRQADGSTYRGRLQVGSTGSTSLAISRVNGAVETGLGRVALPFIATKATTISVEFRVTGGSSGSGAITIGGRAWVAGSSMPDWQSIVTDSSSSRITKAGAAGLWEYASSSNAAAVTSRYDNLVLSANPAPAALAPVSTPTPTPTATTTPTATPTPTPTTTPAPAANPQPAQGATPVGTATYAAPATALYVSPTSGSDTNAGTLAKPFKTVAAAITASKTGQTIVLRAGVYHEAVTIPTNKTLSIQAYPKEAVWFDGSTAVTSWSASGSTWKTSGWSFFGDSSMDGVADNPGFVDPAHPMAARPDQVFIDGTALRQVATAAEVTAGTFAVDAASKSITIGSNPAGHDVRASNLTQAIAVLSPGSTLQGFGVRRYATSYSEKGAVRLGSTSETARDLVIQDNAMIGINVQNNAATLDHLTVQRNGLMGIGVNASYGLVIKNSLVTGNNSEQFKPAPVSGGMKITRSRGVTITNNNTSNNYGSGIWLDESCYNATITKNTSSSNQYTGIQLELGSTAIIADNDLSNEQFAMQIIDSSNVKIFNNTMGGNSKFDVRIEQDERRQAAPGAVGRDPRQPVPDPTVTWLTKNITVANNVFGSGGYWQVYAFDAETHVSADAMALTISGNLFNQRTTTAQPTLVGWGQGDNVTVTRLDTVAAINAKNPAFVNVETSSSLPLSGMTSAIAGAQSGAVPLPADVAAALGQRAGTKKLGHL
ncbi:hypothetical protein GCM10011399_04570 [Subtercola lobariae]|uniref:Right handed beta helix domain-containing protein n=1 Tax=Subtercola lobariae TaxID=1588641 RepID=A0A917B130_9MICO|nr:hypothetical protein GCM10011399_04570 [Subtercola lobariae]